MMWNIHGAISPITDDVSIDRSPYEISMLDFVKKFSFSNERVAILRGFLYYRKFLYSLGITAGFQWVNGSFTENVETLRNRPPNDIDVVSFIAEPENPLPDELFNNLYIKQQYQVDGYFVDLNKSTRTGQMDSLLVQHVVAPTRYQDMERIFSHTTFHAR